MLFANCHFHSTFSDGVYTPERLVELAKGLGHRALILTDHDTIRGCYYLNRAARKAGLLSLMGCEFSTKNAHIVGVDFDPYTKKMSELLQYVSAKQTTRSKWLFERGLESGTLRPGITWQEVLDFHPHNDYFCNNQVFDAMVARGIYRYEEYPEFFKNTFGRKKDEPNREAQICKETGYYTPDAERVIDAILDAGGIPIVAHPARKSELADEFLRLGAKGFETRHPHLPEEDALFFTAYCKEHNLYQSGGTDHSSVLGGLADRMPNEDYPPESGYVTEEHFMKMYRRELG